MSFLISTFLLFSCGKNSDTANVTLNIGIPTSNGIQKMNLMKSMTSLPAILSSTVCEQKNLYAAIRLNNDFTQFFTFPIDVTTPITGTVPTTDAAITDLFASATLNDDIVLAVPKGAVFDFGVFGSFTFPRDLDSDDVCDLSPGNILDNNTTYPNFSASGRRKVAVSGDTTLNLKVFTMAGYSMGDASLGCQNPNDYENLNQQCAKKDFVSIYKVSPGGDSFIYVKLEYLFGKNRPEHVFQAFNGPSASSTIKIPRVFPIIVRFKYNAGPTEQVQIIREQDAVAVGEPTPADVDGSEAPFFAQEY